MKEMRNPPLRVAAADPDAPAARARLDRQAGAGILGVIAMLGLIFALVQGSVLYRAKSSAKFLSAEKGKILAQQAAEAGVEANIADLGSRRLRVDPHMSEYTTYSAKRIGNSTFTTRLTALGMGPAGDTVQLVSLGSSASSSQSVRARLRLKDRIDTTTRTVLVAVDADTIVTNTTMTEPETTVTTVVQDPEEMPALETTAAYAACMASGNRRCDICHIPQGNPANRHVIGVNRNAVHTHIGHHGDYVTTDGTCDIYNPREETTVSMVTRVVSDTQVVDRNIYDDVVTVDTITRIQILSWK